MRRVAPHRLASVLLMLCSALAPSVGSAQGEIDETERWVPSAAFSFDVIGQRASGSVESSDISGPPISTGGCQGPQQPNGLCALLVPSQQPLTPPSSGSDVATAALVGLSLEVMSPRLTPALQRPRLFAHVDGSLAFAFKRKLTGEGSIDTMALPKPPQGSNAATNNSEGSIGGQGNRVFYEVKQLGILSAGAGMAFTFDLWGRRIRVKPSFEYMLQNVKYQGQANRAVQLRGGNAPPPSSIADFRLLYFRAEDDEIQHGIGGGLELEADTQRLGPLMLSVFLSGRAYHVLGDVGTTLCSDTPVGGGFSPDACETGVGERVVWNFEPESTIWRGAVGLRFRFAPE